MGEEEKHNKYFYDHGDEEELLGGGEAESWPIKDTHISVYTAKGHYPPLCKAKESEAVNFKNWPSKAFESLVCTSQPLHSNLKCLALGHQKPINLKNTAGPGFHITRGRNTPQNPTPFP